MRSPTLTTLFVLVTLGALLPSAALATAQTPAGRGQPAPATPGGARGAQPAGETQAEGRGGRGRGGRGAAAPAPPSAPTPRLANGRVNLDASPGQKGFWNVMQGSVFGRTGS